MVSWIVKEGKGSKTGPQRVSHATGLCSVCMYFVLFIVYFVIVYIYTIITRSRPEALLITDLDRGSCHYYMRCEIIKSFVSAQKNKKEPLEKYL